MKKQNLSDWIEAITSGVRLIIKTSQVHQAEAKYNCDFGGQLSKADLGYGQREGYDYTPSPNHVKKFCKRHVILPQDRVMDIGCGKGYAMYLLSKYPFAKVYGIEKNSELADVALQNMSHIDPDRFRVFSVDAMQMSLDSSTKEAIKHTNYYYLYNPFPANVVSRVLDIIEEEYESNNRTITVWYAAPDQDCLDVVMQRVQKGLWQQTWSRKSYGQMIYEFVIEERR